MNPSDLLDRATQSIKAIVKSIVEPRLLYLGVYEIKVESVSGGMIRGAPTDQTLGLPLSIVVPTKSGLLAVTCTPTPNTTALVRFINGDPKRPVLDGADSVDDAILAQNGAPSYIGRIADQVMMYMVNAPIILTLPPGTHTGLVAGPTPVAVGPAQQHRAHLRVVAPRQQLRGDQADHLQRERVERLGAVQREDAQVATPFGQDSGFRHGPTPTGPGDRAGSAIH